LFFLILNSNLKDAESEKKISQLKLIEYRSDIERLKGEIKALKKSNQKLQLRVQIFEKKLQLQNVKEERITTMYEKTNDEFEQIKIERDTYLTLVIYK
jgi:flagellar biosynthesis chaperone FliJ